MTKPNRPVGPGAPTPTVPAGYIAPPWTPSGECFVCHRRAVVMLALEMPDGEHHVCSRCWREQYNCR